MRRFVDLHVHSTASDGCLAPAEVVALAEGKKLAAVALTDHDTTAGLAEARAAAAAFPQLRFIAGIEVSAAFPDGTLHILGLGIDEHSAALAHLAADLRAARADRNPKIIAKLQSLGLAIDMADVIAQTGFRVGRAGSSRSEAPARGIVSPHAEPWPGGQEPACPTSLVLGRLHIARALAAKGYVRTLDEAFVKYIGRRAPAYVEKDKLPASAVIASIHSAGGLAALAHPSQLRYTNLAQLERIVKDLAAGGLDAIEVYHSDHSPAQTREYLHLARQLNLGVTGGSDFHGPAKPAVPLGRPKVSITMIAGIVADKLLGKSSA
jgi:predicted metal-dependent phosphoesterase TrpH